MEPIAVQLRIVLFVGIWKLKICILDLTLWEYKKAAINMNIFKLGDAEPDNTAPEFETYALVHVYPTCTCTPHILAIGYMLFSQFNALSILF